MNRKAGIRRLLVANRSEIAIRVFRAASELSIKTIAIYAEGDKHSLHRFKTDEAYLIGRGRGPLEAYLSVDDILEVAQGAGADAIHPGYGFLLERPEFANACAAAGITFIGPRPETMRMLGNKVAARNLAISVDVPVMPATGPLPQEPVEISTLAASIGYPVMLKASWGGGGRGMWPIENENALLEAVLSGRREAKSAFGNDEVYLEKLVRRARHVEVQILGDAHGGLVHLFERDCTIQRRHQKVVERAPAPYLSEPTRQSLCEAAIKIGRAAGYVGAGTVEFLLDIDTNDFYFIEVDPRIQVEHTVTEVVTGLGIVKAQILVAEGAQVGSVTESGIPPQEAIELRGHAIQCRITTEDPDNNFIPDYGRIAAHRSAHGFGIRTDSGTAYTGAIVTRHYDALLEKVVVWAPNPAEATARMLRALREFRIRGIATNLSFLEAVLDHPSFAAGGYTTKFIDETPELFRRAQGRDRATRLLTYIADVIVNGRPDIVNRSVKSVGSRPEVPIVTEPSKPGHKQHLERIGPVGLAKWVQEHESILITDTTMRDAHQSLLATRMRTFDILAIAEAYAQAVPELFSLECWGGATFDVSMRFLIEDPWERLCRLRESAPNMLLEALVRGANGFGYTSYPDDTVAFFVKTAAEAGIDVFRIFDCLNWVDYMRVSIDAVCEANKLAEGALRYTGDINDLSRAKGPLKYYVNLAKELELAGCYLLGIKDMAGLLNPAAASKLIKALRDEVGLPIHLHTHDTSGISAATLLAAVDAGVDIVDAAMDSMSGFTSQACLGSLALALRELGQDTGLNIDHIQTLSSYWHDVRIQYAAFESEFRVGGSDVYFHEMPGGQYTNLREQARSMGLADRWSEIVNTYRFVNQRLGDIVTVTPSSKVVGDLALMTVAQGHSFDDVLDPTVDIAFPASVVSLLRGELGQPPGGGPRHCSARSLGARRQ